MCGAFVVCLVVGEERNNTGAARRRGFCCFCGERHSNRVDERTLPKLGIYGHTRLITQDPSCRDNVCLVDD